MTSVLFISKYFEPHIGGVEKHILELSKELIKKGYKVKIITSKYEESLKDKEVINGIHIIRIPIIEKKFLGLINIWVDLFKRYRSILNADIIHVHDIFIWYLPLRFIFFWKKVYLTQHGWEGIYPIPLKNKIIKLVSNKLSSGTISVGPFIDKYYGTRSKLVTYGAVKTPKTFSKKSKKIVFVGRLAEDTGLKMLLGSFKYFKYYKIEFCGDGPLKSECLKLGKVHGFVNPEKFLKKAEICFASGYLTILEAMSNKCKVICAYDNELKRSYYLETPFSDWISASDNSEKIFKQAKKITTRDINLAFQWTKEQTWSNLSEKYINLWAIKS